MSDCEMAERDSLLKEIKKLKIENASLKCAIKILKKERDHMGSLLKFYFDRVWETENEI